MGLLRLNALRVAIMAAMQQIHMHHLDSVQEIMRSQQLAQCPCTYGFKSCWHHLECDGVTHFGYLSCVELPIQHNILSLIIVCS